MKVEERAVNRALSLPRNVQPLFPDDVRTAAVGLIGDTAVLVLQTSEYGREVSYALCNY